jgi:hypothetical protein
MKFDPTQELDFFRETIETKEIVGRFLHLCSLPVPEQIQNLLHETAPTNRELLEILNRNGGCHLDMVIPDFYKKNSELFNDIEEAQNLQEILTCIRDEVQSKTGFFLRGMIKPEEAEKFPFPELLMSDEGLRICTMNLAYDCGDLREDARWIIDHIDWEGVADSLKRDVMSSVSFKLYGGEASFEFWFRTSY